MEFIAQKEDPIGLAYENYLQLQKEVHASNIFTYKLDNQLYDLNHLSMIRWFYDNCIDNSITSTNIIRPKHANEVIDQYWTQEYLLHHDVHISLAPSVENAYQPQLSRSVSTSSQEPQNNETVPQYVATGSLSWSDNQSEITQNTNDQRDENQGNDLRKKSGMIHDTASTISPKSQIRRAPSVINRRQSDRKKAKRADALRSLANNMTASPSGITQQTLQEVVNPVLQDYPIDGYQGTNYSGNNMNNMYLDNVSFNDPNCHENITINMPQ